MNPNFEWLPRVFLRAPLYSYTAFSRERLAKAVKSEVLQQALYLASPEFYAVIAGQGFEVERLKTKEVSALLRYYNRMCFRPTPFGAFASFSLVPWCDSGKLNLAGEAEAVLHLLPGQQLVRACRAALPAMAPEGLLGLNPTAYRAGDMIRFIKTEVQPSGKYLFFLTAIAGEELNVALFDWLGERRCTVSQVLDWLKVKTGGAEAELLGYLGFLTGEQLLYTAQQGDIFEAHAEFGEYLAAGSAAAKADGGEAWSERQSRPLSSPHPLSDLFRAQATRLPVDAPEKGWFYAALEREGQGGGVPVADRDSLWKALLVMGVLAPDVKDTPLERFKKAFRNKFDQQSVPLLAALDPDMGIVYGNVGGKGLHDGWLKDVNFGSAGEEPESVQWSAAHRLILQKWVGNKERRPDEPIVLEESDIASLGAFEAAARFPPSMGVMYTRSAGKLVLDSAGGVTGTALIGRFSVFSDEVEALARQIAGLESAANPDVVFADIAQLSDAHVDNINRRKHIYTHQIPVNTVSGAAGEGDISLRDLYLSLKGDVLVLESKSLNKRVIPRLTTAFNFVHNELSLFRFLCEMQYQGIKPNYSIDLEMMVPGLAVYPRVTYANVVLTQAKWYLSEKDVRELTAKPWSIGRLHLLRQERMIPAQVSSGVGDQQLTFDLCDDEQAFWFLGCITGAKQVMLKEYLPPDGLVSIDGKPHNNQCIAFLYKKTATYRSYGVETAERETAVQRNFLPGSDWIYLKLYCTAATADDLLHKLIAPLTSRFEKDIKTWFFIRYADPNEHLRLRVRIDEPAAGRLLAAVRAELESPLLRDSVGWVQSEVYQRELERYGFDLIDDVEHLFCLGSACVLRWMDSSAKGEVAQGANLFGIYTAYLMAREFWDGRRELEEFIGERAAHLRAEYGNPGAIKKQFDTIYREQSRGIIATLDGQGAIDEESSPLAVATAAMLRQVREIARKTLDFSIARRRQLIGDLVHMQLNRIFSHGQRRQEALSFHCLYKYMRYRNGINAEQERGNNSNSTTKN